jgi:hypothetical protein
MNLIDIITAQLEAENRIAAKPRLRKMAYRDDADIDAQARLATFQGRPHSTLKTGVNAYDRTPMPDDRETISKSRHASPNGAAPWCGASVRSGPAGFVDPRQRIERRREIPSGTQPVHNVMAKRRRLASIPYLETRPGYLAKGDAVEPHPALADPSPTPNTRRPTETQRDPRDDGRNPFSPLEYSDVDNAYGAYSQIAGPTEELLGEWWNSRSPLLHPAVHFEPPNHAGHRGATAGHRPFANASAANAGRDDDGFNTGDHPHDEHDRKAAWVELEKQAARADAIYDNAMRRLRRVQRGL